MAARRVPGVRQLSRKETRELKRLPWVRDDALSNDTSEARLLPDGRVLLCSPRAGYLTDDEKGTLYPSREALEKLHRDIAEQAAKPPLDPSHTLLPPIDDFLRDVEAHAGSLGETIKVADDVLDRSVESLDAVDRAMKRIPWSKRQVPEIVTPLVAYVGEVMRRASGGRWTKNPRPLRREIPVHDPAEVMAFQAARGKLLPIADAAAARAKAEARARGASGYEEDVESMQARDAVLAQLVAPKPLRVEIREDNEPMIMGRDGRILQPYAVVYLPMVEPSRRIPLRAAVDVYLLPYRSAGDPDPPEVD